MLLIFTVILVALLFEFTNGFHDTANSIATVIGTKVLTPRGAIMLAVVTNLVGALTGGAVAETIAKGLVNEHLIPPSFASQMLLCALTAAITWNLVTWYFGMPSSSSHALVGGLVGAAWGAASGNPQAVIWGQAPGAGAHWWAGKGVLYKVVIPMMVSPLLGFLVAFMIMAVLYLLLQKARPQAVSHSFGQLQILSAGFMGYAHGTNDAQKTMGVIALALAGATQAGALDTLPDWLGFIKIPPPAPGQPFAIAWWIKVLCSLTMASGTAMGGWRIIKTLGHKLVKLQPVQGFAAETGAAAVLLVTSRLGMPVSTTHVITTAVMGVGAAKRMSAVKWMTVERILWAWIMTLPLSGLLGYGLAKLALAL